MQGPQLINDENAFCAQRNLTNTRHQFRPGTFPDQEPLGIVDGLELVHIHQDKEKRLLGSLKAADRLYHADIKRLAVAQAGQLVGTLASCFKQSRTSAQ